MIEYYLYYFYYSFLGFPLVVRIATFFITFSLPFILFCILRMTRINNETVKNSKAQKKLEKKYGEAIKEIISNPRILINSEIHNKINANVRKIKKRAKFLLTDIILTIKNETPDANYENYKNVIEYFQIPSYWERKLKNGSIASKYDAICKFEEMEINISGSVITPLTYSRNKYLRKKARASFIHLNKNIPFKFFSEDFDRDFNEWDKFEIHRFLTLKGQENIPLLTQWIKNSKETNFICFLIDEIKYLGQEECAPFLHSLIESDNPLICRHCIDTLGELKYQPAEADLIEKYSLLPLPLQESIVLAIGKFKTGKALTFLENAYHNTYDSENEKNILKTIYNYGEEGRMLFNTLSNKAVGFSRLIFEHVSNPLIKFM